MTRATAGSVAFRDERLRTTIIAARYGPKATWTRNSLLARRQRESEERHLLGSAQKGSTCPPRLLESGAPEVARPSGRRGILGFVGDRHYLVHCWTRLAYFFESLSAFDSATRSGR